MRGRHGRAPTRRPAEVDELLAERAPLGDVRGGLQTDRTGEQRRGQCLRVAHVARQRDCTIGERSTVPALELVGGVLERLERHEPSPKRTVIVAEHALRLVEQGGDLVRVGHDGGHWLGEHGDRPSELLR